MYIYIYIYIYIYKIILFLNPYEPTLSLNGYRKYTFFLLNSTFLSIKGTNANYYKK